MKLNFISCVHFNCGRVSSLNAVFSDKRKHRYVRIEPIYFSNDIIAVTGYVDEEVFYLSPKEVKEIVSFIVKLEKISIKKVN